MASSSLPIFHDGSLLCKPGAYCVFAQNSDDSNTLLRSIYDMIYHLFDKSFIVYETYRPVPVLFAYDYAGVHIKEKHLVKDNLSSKYKNNLIIVPMFRYKNNEKVKEFLTNIFTFFSNSTFFITCSTFDSYKFITSQINIASTIFKSEDAAIDDRDWVFAPKLGSKELYIIPSNHYNYFKYYKNYYEPIKEAYLIRILLWRKWILGQTHVKVRYTDESPKITHTLFLIWCLRMLVARDLIKPFLQHSYWLLDEDNKYFLWRSVKNN